MIAEGSIKRVVSKVKSGKYKGKKTIDNFIFQACVDCGKTRWVRYEQGKSDSVRCRSCAMRKNNIHLLKRGLPNWKGGRIRVHGYIRVLLPNHYRTDKNGYILEHILAWEEYHKKKLPKGWVIHHLNGRKDDNRPENLMACRRGSHIHLAEPFKKRIQELEVELERVRIEAGL